MTLSAWRPLKDAPKDSDIVVRHTDGGAPYIAEYKILSGTGRWENAQNGRVLNPLRESFEFVPIADTYELDRAVQVKIAEAFGALIDVLVQNEHAIDPYDDGGSSDCCDAHVTWAIQDVRRILHTSMGGRIPDEVP